jgi:chitosanase
MLFLFFDGRYPFNVSLVDILFGHKVPSGVGDKTINIGALKRLGDQEATKLMRALGV